MNADGKVSREGRAMALTTALVCAAALGIAVGLEPDRRGYGTHEQLGLGACNMLAYVGVPCPFCGMTTAFAHGVRGRVVEAILVQPAGAVFFLGAVVTIVVGLWVGVSGWRLRWVNWAMSSKWVWVGVGVLVMVGWVWSVVRYVL